MIFNMKLSKSIVKLSIIILMATCTTLTYSKVDCTQSYMDKNCHINIIGNDGMRSIIEPLMKRFEKDHPDIHFNLILEGSSTAAPALITGKTLFAPMTRSIWNKDLDTYFSLYKTYPKAINIGWSGYGPRKEGKTPPAIYVNQKNPLAGLSERDLIKILTATDHEGVIQYWSQLQLKGEWENHKIHVYGLKDDGGSVSSLRRNFLNSEPLSVVYESFDTVSQVLDAVSNDKYGIGVLGWADANNYPAVRILPLAKGTSTDYYLPTKENIIEGNYVFASPIRIYINDQYGKIDSISYDFLKLALSEEGQDIIHQLELSEEGYLPLSKKDIQSQLDVLNKLTIDHK